VIFAKFLTLISESGISSWTLLRNIFPASHPERQQVALGLAASSEYLRGMGACRVHGGGFAGTIQAFVPKDMLDGYVRKMEELFGQGSCSVVQIRNIPASEPFA
jgi:galactokinase